MRALTAALMTALLVPVASASAQTAAERFPADGADMARAMQIAGDFWQTRPCGGDVAMRWGRLEAGTRAEAVWQNYVDPWSNPAANFDCSITFNTALPFDWPDLCTTVVHEVGHLLGHQHTDEDHHVMNEHAGESIAACGGGEAASRATRSAVPTPTTSRARGQLRCVRRLRARGVSTYRARRTCARVAARSELRR